MKQIASKSFPSSSKTLQYTVNRSVVIVTVYSHIFQIQPFTILLPFIIIIYTHARTMKQKQTSKEKKQLEMKHRQK